MCQTLNNLPKLTHSELDAMGEYFGLSKEDEDRIEGKTLMLFSDYLSWPETVKQDGIYWIGWEGFSFDEMVDKLCIENLLREGRGVDFYCYDCFNEMIKFKIILE